jgi:transcriptional regulator with XRE-family HTH domain
MNDDRELEAKRLGATIRALRSAHGLKVGELAVALGKSQAYVSNIEAGRKYAPLQLCREIATLFRIPLAAITIEGYKEIAKAAEEAKAAA